MQFEMVSMMSMGHVGCGGAAVVVVVAITGRLLLLLVLLLRFCPLLVANDFFLDSLISESV